MMKLAFNLTACPLITAKLIEIFRTLQNVYVVQVNIADPTLWRVIGSNYVDILVSCFNKTLINQTPLQIEYCY